jgi:glycine cleavage system H lipoate-binding protein
MVFLFVILTIVVFIGIEYYLHRRKVQKSIPEMVKNLPLSQALQLVSPGTYLQPTMTWGKILDTGNLMVGLQPLLVGITGTPDKLELLPQGNQVKKGDSLIRMKKDSKHLDIVSPVNGKVIATNPEVEKEMSWDKLGQSWIYTIKPQNLSSEIPNWIIAEKIKPWLNDRYQAIKGFFQKQLSSNQLGETMADGGELPVGILMKFDEPIWSDFSREYLSRS